MLLIFMKLFMQVNNLGEDVLRCRFRPQKSKVYAVFILVELATNKAVFPNMKICFVLNTVCVTLLGLER